ncbi:hypothetical protein [Pseudomonas sp. RIT-PI-S]|uniref:hypothetical protein n=1 Tax=Pseudomonas sp. RIT-PI-S TaxID=3035295 RepID=UPI0021DA797E|nr:hypothetical protein [Pseudomonas sp. RIT-PI-S]
MEVRSQFVFAITLWMSVLFVPISAVMLAWAWMIRLASLHRRGGGGDHTIQLLDARGVLLDWNRQAITHLDHLAYI